MFNGETQKVWTVELLDQVLSVSVDTDIKIITSIISRREKLIVELQNVYANNSLMYRFVS